MNKFAFPLSAVSLALAGTAQAQEVDPAIAELTRPESAVSVGLGYWSKDRPRLGTYDGMSQEGAYGLLDALINTRDDRTGTWFILDARRLGLDTRELRAEWLRQGNLGVFAEYSRTPRDEPYTVFTAVQGIGTTTQRVPTPSATTLGELHLGTMREAIGGGFSKILGGGYDFRFSVKSEDKTGDRLWGRGGAAEFAAEPIDSNTRQMEAILAYVGKSFQVQGGYHGSWYTNHNGLVDTANINAAGVTSNPFFLSLPLDNQAHQVFVNGGYNLSERTRATFKVAYTHATQDEQIPVGPGVPVFSGAPTHLDGQLDTTLLQAGLTSRATNDFSWLASLRYYDSNERTPQVRVIQTAATCGTCVDNTPLRFETISGKLEGTYRMAYGLSVVGGLEHAKQERDVPFGNANAAGLDAQRYVPWRAEIDETTYRLELRRALAETLNGRIAYSYSQRDGSEFTPAAADAPQANLINPIHIADRDRNKVRLMLDWAVIEPLTLTLNVEYAQDDYGYSDARPYGLRDGTASVLSLDAAYAISEKWQLSAWYTRDQAKATQFAQRNANSGAAEAVKEANLEDTGDTFGAGLRGTLMARLRAGLDVLYSKSVNKYPETLTLIGPGTLYPVAGGVAAVGPLPDITNTMTRIKLHAAYALQKTSELRFEYAHEIWKTDDWSWMFANATPFTYGATTDGTQVRQAPKQTADWLALRYIYRFQ
jgi:MtrB/PioB family decaheme-associated outer membrane protein